MDTDPQVLKAKRFPERKSLLDVVLKQYNVSTKNAANPFAMRVVLCGQHSADSLSSLEDVSHEACVKADLTNPLASDQNSEESLSSVIIDYGERFIQLVEGFERHVMYYLWEVHYQQKTLKIEKCHIIFLDDDVEINGTPNWIYINKVPPSVVCSSASGERSEEEIADGVVQDLKMLMELAAAGKNESGARKSAFADGAKMNFTKLFPKEENIFHYLSFKLFLTLQEYEKNFKEFPNYTRDVEICHPPEDPLKI